MARAIAFCSVCVAFLAVSSTAPAITIPTVLVGDAGNQNDTAASPSFPDRFLGAVNYDYRIGTTKVTVGQYATFLNAVATVDDANALYTSEMGVGR